MRNIIFAFILSSILFGYIAQAHERRDKNINIDIMLREADGVFLGKVEGNEYAISRGDEKYEPLPHTFVKFKIEKVFKGSPNQGVLTLRFLGGRGKESAFMSVEGSPLFDIGDKDIIFVKNNEVFSCPLLKCSQGRFRLIKGMMYSENGQQVLRTLKEQINFGPYDELVDVLTHHISQTVLKTVILNEPGEVKPEEGIINGKHFRADEFIEFLNEHIKKLDPNGLWLRLPVIPSADPKKFFSIKPLLPIQKSPMRPIPVKRDETSEELRERQAYEENGANPVLRTK